jgi:hypothetical protein
MILKVSFSSEKGRGGWNVWSSLNELFFEYRLVAEDRCDERDENEEQEQALQANHGGGGGGGDDGELRKFD